MGEKNQGHILNGFGNATDQVSLENKNQNCRGNREDLFIHSALGCLDPSFVGFNVISCEA